MGTRTAMALRGEEHTTSPRFHCCFQDTAAPPNPLLVSLPSTHTNYLTPAFLLSTPRIPTFAIEHARKKSPLSGRSRSQHHATSPVAVPLPNHALGFTSVQATNWPPLSRISISSPVNPASRSRIQASIASLTKSSKRIVYAFRTSVLHRERWPGAGSMHLLSQREGDAVVTTSSAVDTNRGSSEGVDLPSSTMSFDSQDEGENVTTNARVVLSTSP
ncbi:hypothetical protein BKA70DRAFT_750430 [Coprinopsis sp. MPI-PUGE-AT-0042]|nr:hypothetical protein BKA70DRAFT_750430 [Coprinopsis sp. MPI-PUGE-AT-0042]